MFGMTLPTVVHESDDRYPDGTVKRKFHGYELKDMDMLDDD